MEIPRIYYNTVTIDDYGLGFIVGLLQEVYSPNLKTVGRSRNILAYQPQLNDTQPAFPVYHERLTVFTRTDWLQTNRGERQPRITDFFQAYPDLDRLTYFQTYNPRDPRTRGEHLLPGDYWLARIADARVQLQHDLKAFIHVHPPKLPPNPISLEQLGYFSA